jgi:hypothetical protein
MIYLLAFVSNSHQNFYWKNISRQGIFILILSFKAVKSIFDKMLNFFSFGRIFCPKFADIPFWNLATVKVESRSSRAEGGEWKRTATAARRWDLLIFFMRFNEKEQTGTWCL